MYYICKNIKNYIIAKKKSAPKSIDKFELSDRLFSVSDIKDYFEHIIKGIK